ncbi:MAG: hypothetical protein H0U76_01170 [Ktedonobacteraceae bacterium]|nr:hypothetical protein [Ktedonobacteraceae bacterium]
MSVRTRLIFLASLLLLSIGATIFAANATLGALQNVHQHELLKKHEDLSLIEPWMTIPYISRVYQVPEKVFYQPLHLRNDSVIQHSTLQIIATHEKQPVEKVIHVVRVTILSYRKSHPARPGKPSPTPIIKRGEHTAH